eukprot:3341455-Rhodomonas_salina.2
MRSGPVSQPAPSPVAEPSRTSCNRMQARRCFCRVRLRPAGPGLRLASARRPAQLLSDVY